LKFLEKIEIPGESQLECLSGQSTQLGFTPQRRSDHLCGLPWADTAPVEDFVAFAHKPDICRSYVRDLHKCVALEKLDLYTVLYIDSVGNR
jgi:hypothetical protein